MTKNLFSHKGNKVLSSTRLDVLARAYGEILRWPFPIQQTATSNDLGREIEAAGEGEPSLVKDPK
jgi:hypothetical protein